MKYQHIIKIITIITILLILQQTNTTPIKANEEQTRIKQVYKIPTTDGQQITLTRYIGNKQNPIMLVHGMGSNHIMYDYDENHSLPRYLNDQDWDVWMLDLRTCDGDGDYFFSKNSDREYINRYWDFDNTLLKIDVVTAIDFIKKVTLKNKIFFCGHSYGGYLAYAYAMLIGEENLSGIITTGACPYANPIEFQPSRLKMLQYGFYLGKKAYVNPFGRPWDFYPKIRMDIYKKIWKPTANTVFYYNTTPAYIQKNLGYYTDSQPAGVYVDMYFGKDPRKYNGYWFDPQTLYNYSGNLNKITVPILFIAGDNDTQDPKQGILNAYENVSSTIKEFYSFPKHSHLDLLLGENADELIFPKITMFMDNVIGTEH